MTSSEFCEAHVLPHDDHAVYRELLLLADDATLQEVKVNRLPSWALWSIRIPESLKDTTSEAMHEEAEMLVKVIRAGTATGARRYDRIIIVQKDSKDIVAPVIQCIRDKCPDILRERRLFHARMPDCENQNLAAALERAIGSAIPLDWDGSSRPSG